MIIVLIILLPFIFLAIWIWGIVYCKAVARRLEMKENNALLAAIFLPAISIIIYYFYSFRKKTQEKKMRIVRVAVSVITVFIILFAGIIYYIIGTPEYSLYKLKQSIINNDDENFKKYLDIESIADNFDESPVQTQEWIDSLNTSILEIKEENPDKSKDAIAYIDTDLSGKYLKNASLTFDTDSDEALISLRFDDEGTKLFADITKRNVDKKVAIFLNGDLISAPFVQSEIIDGEAVISGIDSGQASFLINIINEEKDGIINGFKIRKKRVDKDYAEITIGKTDNSNGFELIMSKLKGGYWILDEINAIIMDDGNEKLPNPDGEKVATFEWKYKGKSYSLNETLYDSYYKFYNALPVEDVFNGESLVGQLEKDNELFIRGLNGDKTISELAYTIKELGAKNNLNENQLVELVSTFVQTIPYDIEKFNNRKAGLNGITEKPTYPYEVLYSNKGVCQDKSYLAYLLLKEMGYGISLFLFPDPADNHMAVGVKCPIEYSNYDSGYCFLETTSLGNKIGWSPNLSKEFGIATSNLELGDFSNDSTESKYNPLGRIEIVNKIDGKEYTGIIETRAKERELDNLLASIRRMDQELNASDKDLDIQNRNIDEMISDLKKLEKKDGEDAYKDYEKLYSKYEKAYSSLEKDIDAYNAKIEKRNQLNDSYNNLLQIFYE